MSAIIHPGKCDQAKECPCPEVCLNSAWHRDSEDKKWLIDESKCTNCGLCVTACPSGAVLLATTPEEKEKILEDIRIDKKFTPEKLFVERYGGMPVEDRVEIKTKGLGSKIKEKFVLIEFFNDDSIHCLIKCTPYKEFASYFKIYKIDIDKNKGLKEQYDIKELPSLIAFSKGRVIKKLDGFVDSKEKLQAFLEDIADII